MTLPALSSSLNIASAHVVVELGDPMALSGLSEQSCPGTRDGVSGRQDVPVMQSPFSNKQTHGVQRPVLIPVSSRALAQLADAGDSMERQMGLAGVKSRIATSAGPRSETLQRRGLLRVGRSPAT